MKTPSLGRRHALQLALLTALVGLLSVAAAGVAGGAPTPSKWTAVPVQQHGATITVAKSLTSRIAQTDPSLVGRSDATPVNVMVKLDYDPVASYLGTVAGYEATSPKKTGKELRENRAAVSRYEGLVASLESAITRRVRDRVGGVAIRDSYRTVYGGVSMTVPANKVGELLAVPGVVAVQKDELQQPLTDTTPGFVGATNVWPSLGGQSKAGEGVIVGVLDTGIWPEHPSFQDPGIAKPAGSWGCEFGDGSVPALGPAFTCNDKLIGAYAMTDTYLAVIGSEPDEFCTASACSARDAEGHGTHTASTAAGSPVASATLLGVNRGAVSGIAPGAHVIMYRVCLAQGCFGSDSVAAVSQAITDGVDVINFSISGGSSPYTDPVELAFLDAYNAGILVNASAGNAGPGAGTANHGGPWVNTVAASTSPRSFLSTLQLTATGGDTVNVPGVTVTAGIGAPTDVVVNTVDPLCLNPSAPATFTGKVVVCKRGQNARVEKGYNVLQGGAAGMILYNPAVQQLNSDSHWLPAIHVEGPDTGTGDAAKLVSFISSHTGVKATWVNGTATAAQADVIASFSSRGPLGDFIKPDVTAPGVQILAGMTPQHIASDKALGPQGELFQAIAGTSMSSPHAAGVSALVKAAHPDWTPGQIKSALMTSAVQQGVVKEDGVTPSDPFDRGSGSIRADRAVNPTVTFDESAANYAASTGDALGRINLNVPSINAPTMPGSIMTSRTMKNVSGRRLVMIASAVEPAGSHITVWPSLFTIAPGASRTIDIRIDGKNLAKNQQYFGQITLTPLGGGNPAVLPVAFFAQQGGAVSLSHVCDPLVFPRNGTSACTVTATNRSFSPANVDLRLTGGLWPFLEVRNVTPPAVKTLFGFRWSGVLAPAEPADVHIDDGTSPAGYLPLSLFGVAPIAGVGDETITNFNVPAFQFGGETHTRIGLVSNGYLVVGGGTAADVSFLNQSLPNAARPNNVLAPFWTDLNPSAGGAARIGVLTDGINDWLVIDYAAVKEYSTTKTASFEVWIGLNGTEDVSFAYGTVQGNGDLGFLTVGAENSTGSRGENYYVDGTGTLPALNTELRVTSDPPAPGGSAVIGYQVVGRVPGTYSLTAAMTSDLTPGTTQEVQKLQVTRR